MKYLATHEAMMLNAARAILRDICGERTHGNTRSDGMVNNACDVAEEAIFQALNVMSSHGHDAIADAALHPFNPTRPQVDAAQSYIDNYQGTAAVGKDNPRGGTE